MWWIMPSIVALLAAMLVAVAAARLRREIEPTRDTIDGFGRRLRPAIVQLRAENAHTRAKSTREA